MTKTRFFILSLILISALFLGGFSLAQSTDTGPQAWVEFPLHGETMEMGIIPIVAYAASTEGVSSLTVSVDGETLPVESLQPLTTDGSTRLVRVDHSWQPPGEGKYTVIANAGGATASITFCVVTCYPLEEVDESAPTETHTPEDEITFTPSPTPAPDDPTYTPSPTAADTATFTPTTQPTATDTPSPYPSDTPTPYTESSAEFWAAPDYLNAGECTTLSWNVYGDFQTVYFEGSTVNASGADSECPPESYTYHLQVVEMDGSYTDYWASVEVYVPPADSSGPSFNYVTHFWEGCTIYGEAGITDPSGVTWAEFWFNHNEQGWAWIQMNQNGEQWVSQVGIDTDGFAGSLVYKVRTLDSLNNESWSGEYTHNYAYCGE
jgi:hypothetical protein